MSLNANQTSGSVKDDHQIPPLENGKSIPIDFNYYIGPEDGAVPAKVNDYNALFGNEAYQTHKLLLHDVRGREHTFTLDTHGFYFRKHENAVAFLDPKDQDARAAYKAGLEPLLRSELWVDHALF